ANLPILYCHQHQRRNRRLHRRRHIRTLPLLSPRKNHAPTLHHTPPPPSQLPHRPQPPFVQPHLPPLPHLPILPPPFPLAATPTSASKPPPTPPSSALPACAFTPSFP